MCDDSKEICHLLVSILIPSSIIHTKQFLIPNNFNENFLWIPGCWVHVSSILKTISSCRVPKQSEKNIGSLSTRLSSNSKTILMTDLADFACLAIKLNSSLFFVLQMRTAPPLLRFGILELGYHKESSSLSVLRPWTGTRSFDLRQKSHRDTSKFVYDYN